MLLDLKNSRLDVVLVPSKRKETFERGGMIRCVQCENPEWYKKLCSKYTSNRKKARLKHDTKIKRREIERILFRLSKNLSTRSKYFEDLKEFSRDFAPF